MLLFRAKESAQSHLLLSGLGWEIPGLRGFPVSACNETYFNWSHFKQLHGPQVPGSHLRTLTILLFSKSQPLCLIGSFPSLCSYPHPLSPCYSVTTANPYLQLTRTQEHWCHSTLSRQSTGDGKDKPPVVPDHWVPAHSVPTGILHAFSGMIVKS